MRTAASRVPGVSDIPGISSAGTAGRTTTGGAAISFDQPGLSVLQRLECGVHVVLSGVLIGEDLLRGFQLPGEHLPAVDGIVLLIQLAGLVHCGLQLGLVGGNRLRLLGRHNHLESGGNTILGVNGRSHGEGRLTGLERMNRAAVNKFHGLRCNTIGVFLLFGRRDGRVGGRPDERCISRVNRFDVHFHINAVTFRQRQHTVLKTIRLGRQRGDRLDLAAVRGGVLHAARIHGGSDLDVVEVRRPTAGLAAFRSRARVRVAEADGILALLEVHAHRSSPEVAPATGVGEHQVLRGLAVHRHIRPTVHDLPGVVRGVLPLGVADGQRIVAILRHGHLVELEPVVRTIADVADDAAVRGVVIGTRLGTAVERVGGILRLVTGHRGVIGAGCAHRIDEHALGTIAFHGDLVEAQRHVDANLGSLPGVGILGFRQLERQFLGIVSCGVFVRIDLQRNGALRVLAVCLRSTVAQHNLVVSVLLRIDEEVAGCGGIGALDVAGAGVSAGITVGHLGGAVAAGVFGFDSAVGDLALRRGRRDNRVVSAVALKIVQRQAGLAVGDAEVLFRYHVRAVGSSRNVD